MKVLCLHKGMLRPMHKGLGLFGAVSRSTAMPKLDPTGDSSPLWHILRLLG